MKTIDLQLIFEFLEEDLRLFREFLESKEIEPTEADLIIDDLKEEISDRKQCSP